MTTSAPASAGYQTRSLVRALAILDAFAQDRPTLSVKDLHELLDLPKPTVSRLASVLEQHGLLRGNGRAYQLGPKTFELGSLFAQQYGIHHAGRPAVEAMARASSQTSSLAILSGPRVVYLIVARPPRPIHHVTEAGSREFAHPTGLGKALLAALSPEQVDELLGAGPLARMTEHTICDLDDLHAELAETRERGYALDQEEFAIGLRCVAIYMELPRLGPAAISVSGPAAEYAADLVPGYLDILHRTAAELEHAFGEAAHYSLPLPGTPRTYEPFRSVSGDADNRNEGGIS
jgi:DNA-binding IclR family transcriptional regulator